jgi:D-3-phosphoglycerate dehydrogenase / 2-oxoglutarate reductase
MSKRILITPRSLTQHHNPDLQALENAGYNLVYARPGAIPTEQELLDLVSDCVGWLAGVEPISERVLRAATELKVISRNGSGVDNIPLALARELGIDVLRAEAANARGVAELAICLALAALRHLPLLHCALKHGQSKLVRGTEICGRLFGLVGCGAIGKIVTRLALGLDARVAAFDVYPDRSFKPGEGFCWMSLEEALASADILSLHCPPLTNGRPLIDRKAISRLKDSGCLVNTARGALIDESAVLEAIDSGKLTAYATDVFQTEPPDPASPLLRHDKVIVSPHIGAYTEAHLSKIRFRKK